MNGPQQRVVRRVVGVASSKNISNMQVGSLGEGKEKVVASIYDTISITSAATHRFFQSSVGNNSKSAADTNMQSGGMVPAGQQIIVDKIKVFFSGSIVLTEAIAKDLMIWIERTVVEFSIGSNKILLQSPLSELLGNPWAIFMAATTAGNSIDNFLGRLPGYIDLRNAPIILGSTIPFELRLNTFDAPATTYIDNGDVKLKIVLSGTKIFLN
jgi:hypothetical protein